MEIAGSVRYEAKDRYQQGSQRTGRIVASLIARTGDWDLAEECAQDAFTRALQTWDRDGVPPRPRSSNSTAPLQ